MGCPAAAASRACRSKQRSSAQDLAGLEKRIKDDCCGDCMEEDDTC